MIEKIKNTRSHRKFTDKKISKEEILKILEGALSSGFNSPPKEIAEKSFLHFSSSTM